MTCPVSLEFGCLAFRLVNVPNLELATVPNGVSDPNRSREPEISRVLDPEFSRCGGWWGGGAEFLQWAVIVSRRFGDRPDVGLDAGVALG